MLPKRRSAAERGVTGLQFWIKNYQELSMLSISYKTEEGSQARPRPLFARRSKRAVDVGARLEPSPAAGLPPE